MKSAIFFDLDGTLIDSRADLATAVNLVRKNYSLPEYSMDTIVKFVGDGIKNLALRSFSELPDSEQDSALALLHRFYAAHEVDETRLYPGVTEGLAALRQAGFLLFIATNKPVGNAKKICSILQIESFFAEIVGAGEGFLIKPAPDMILHATKKYNVELNLSWMLGDHYTDMAAGHSAGTFCAHAKWGFGNLKSERSDAEFNDFKSFVDFVILRRERIECVENPFCIG